MYELNVSPKAMNFILNKGKEEFQGNFAIIIADTTCCGGMVSVELSELENTKKDLNLKQVFPLGTADLPCGIWIEQQAMNDGTIPKKILLDLNPFSRIKKLELKNSDFETPYD
jgi:hypothetical protein